MNNYAHKKLIEAITKLNQIPADSQAYSEWIRAEAHLAFLRENARGNELVVHASGEYTFVHTIAVPNDRLSTPDRDDLMGWSLNPHTSSASYVTGGGRDDVWVERGLRTGGTNAFEGAVQLIFGRTFEGWPGPGRNYFELNQEYAHLAGIHWRPEKRAYCRFDEHGDVDPVVSITTRDDKGSSMALVSFKWEPLEEYLAASNTSLVQMFDFTLLRRSGLSNWSGAEPQEFDESDDFFYQRKIMLGNAAYTRGIQIIRPRRSKKAIFTGITDGWFGGKNKEHAEFIAHDWRNNCIAKISTDANATANYFNAKGNSLPFELSPAFFRPEVLSKYKANREKYTVGEREWQISVAAVSPAPTFGGRLEFKAGWNHEAVLHPLCAFANDIHNLGGGYILIGVAEHNGRPVLPPAGLDPAQIDAIQKELLNLGFSAIAPYYHPIAVPVEIDGRHVLVLWALGGPTCPYKAKISLGKDGKEFAYYIRKGSSTVRARGADETELMSLAATVPHDDRVNPQAKVENLSRELMQDYLQQVGSDLAPQAPHLSLTELGRQMGVVGGPAEVPLPINVGLMMFNPEPWRFFPAMQIDVVWFPKEGPGGNKFSEKIFKGPISRMTRDALDYIKRNLITETVIKRPDRAEAARVQNFPYAAIEEAVVNAVYHRGYYRPTICWQ